MAGSEVSRHLSLHHDFAPGASSRPDFLWQTLLPVRHRGEISQRVLQVSPDSLRSTWSSASSSRQSCMSGQSTDQSEFMCCFSLNSGLIFKIPSITLTLSLFLLFYIPDVFSVYLCKSTILFISCHLFWRWMSSVKQTVNYHVYKMCFCCLTERTGFQYIKVFVERCSVVWGCYFH